MDPLYSTGNSTLCSAMAYVEKSLKKSDCVCVTIALCCMQKLT